MTLLTADEHFKSLFVSLAVLKVVSVWKNKRDKFGVNFSQYMCDVVYQKLKLIQLEVMYTCVEGM